MTVINSATYQGYPCKAAQWRRTDGLAPDNGWVIVDYSVLKELKLVSDAVPWRGEDGRWDAPGAISIGTWFEVLGKRPGTRTTTRPFAPPAAGLRLYGPLVLKSTSDGDGVDETIRYEDVYGVIAEEVSENRARVLEHSEGEVRIDITDVRQYYLKYGTIIGRINCRLENGKYDPRTIKKPARRATGGTTTSAELDGTPWSFEEVIRYLFSQLPGGPSVNLTGLNGLPPPEEIDHIGSPAATVLQGVLDNYGLVAKMQPDGSYFVAKRIAKFLSRGQIARGVGKLSTPTHVSYEVKTASRIDTPPLVMVLGGRRYRRQSQPFVPIFKDLDGKHYRLIDIHLVWDGYSIERVNAQAAKTQGKHFQDVPPKPFQRNFTPQQLNAIASSLQGVEGTAEGQTQDDLHYGRRRVMRDQAYRMYAPAAYFGADAPRNKKGAPYFSDNDDRILNFLPMGLLPTFESQLGGQPRGGRRIAGDTGRIALVQPVVRGRLIDETLFTNNLALAAAHARELDGILRERTFNERRLDEVRNEIDSAEAQNSKADSLASVAQQSESALMTAIFGQSPVTQSLIKRAISEGKKARRTKDQLDGAKNFYERRLNELNALVDQRKARRARDFERLAVSGGVKGVGQVPWGTVPDNTYSLDPRTGILNFSKLCCVVDPPLVFDQEDLLVIGDGSVTATFGRAMDDNEPRDFTSILFCRDGKGGSKLCGANRGSPIKPHVVPDPDLVMYEEEDGSPMNLQSCIDQAEKKAKPILESPDSVDAFVTQFSAFLPCTLERGVNSVQHVWGGGAAHTFVAVNSPAWAGPAGPGSTGKLDDVHGAARTSSKQAG